MPMLLLLAAVVAALPPRPAALTGGESAAYAAWLHQRTLVADRAFGAAPCPAAAVRSLAGRALAPSEAAAWSGTRQALAGPLYLERVRLAGCGRSTVHNFQVSRLRRGGWEAMGALPGETLSTPRQQTELMTSLAGAVLNGRPPLPCRTSEALRSMTHGEARVVRPPDAAGVWTERWPIRVCGVDRTVEITFAPRAAPRLAPVWGG